MADNPGPAAEDVRKVAIAKLKRAASLPRMKDGRRPAMHADGVSEGEKSGISTPAPLQPEDLATADTLLTQPEAEQPHITPQTSNSQPERGLSPPPTESTPDGTPKSNTHKRRSRSRSRSRGSKDLRKLKNQAILLPQSQSPRSEDSSQDEDSSSIPRSTHPSPPPMAVSPIPLHLFAQQQQMQGIPAHPHPLFQNFTPMGIPSLEALQRHIMTGSGLHRSNSAREQAMNKLLGLQEQASTNKDGPPSAFPGAKLTRSNTSTGFERNTRHVARNELFRKLSNRRAANTGGTTTEGEQTSGGEELTTVSKKPVRRSPGNTIIDDRDPPNISPNPAPMLAVSPKNRLNPLSAHPGLHDRHPSPSPSHASSQTPSARRQSLERNRDSAFAKLTGENQFELELHRPLPLQPRLVVEENDDLLPSETIRIPVRSDSLNRSYTPTLSRASPKHDITPQSPQPTSANNPVLSLAASVAALEPQGGYISKNQRPSGPNSRGSMVDEQVVYGEDNWSRRVPVDGVLSWVEPEERGIPVEEDVDEGDEEVHSETAPAVNQVEPQAPQNLSPASPAEEEALLYGPRAPSDFPASSIESNNTLLTHSTGNEADESSSSESLLIRVPSTEPAPTAMRAPEFSDWENVSLHQRPKSKSSRDEVVSGGSNKFDTIKKAITGRLSRTPSLAGSIGRRSRSNSIANRRDVDPGLNRESASSVASGKQEYRSDRYSHQAQLSASESVLSLGSPLPPSAVSHMPVASSNNAKYLDHKLYPFPGIVNLQNERERKRTRGMSISTPDVTLLPLSPERSPGIGPEGLERERKLSTQVSDSRLQLKYKQELPSSASTTPKMVTGANGLDYFTTARQRGAQTPPIKSSLPMDRQGVRRWLGKFVPKSSEPKKKPSFSDIKIIQQKQDGEWDEAAFPGYSRYNASRAVEAYEVPEGSNVNVIHALTALTADGYDSISDSKSSQRSPDRSPVVSSGHPSMQGLASTEFSEPSPISSPLSYLKPEPIGELEQAAHSPYSFQQRPGTTSPGNMDASRSSKGSLPRSSQPSPALFPARSTNLIRRFNYLISSEVGSPLLAEPPRKLITSSPVLQVTGTDVVKRRIMFLFNDLIILAKPLNAESMTKDSRPSAFLDDPVTVKQVFNLKDVQLSSTRRDRKDPFTLREDPTIQDFIREFKRDPDHAVSALMKGRYEPETLACILFNAYDLDRAQLSSYLSRKSNKHILRSFVDQFGFTGVRIDQALRVFWSSVGATTSQVAADNLLPGFATRWFDANSQLVSFDRDLAMRIVGAIMQLNQALHPTPYSDAFNQPRQISAREFISAFRRYDPRYLVADDMLEHIYNAVEREKLTQPLRSTNVSSLRITLKQPIPMRLTYRSESEPITIRIPSPDSSLSIQLLGHGLLFNPPILHFHSSSEASFRVTGTALGSKTIIMSRIGPHAPFYSGLPTSRTLTVEKPFMQNVFQITSPSVGDSQKTYLFSVDETHHHLPHQIESQSAKVRSSSLQGSFDRARTASELLALKVLNDTILAPAEAPPPNGYFLQPHVRSIPSQWTTKSLTRICRQNSLLSSLLITASQTRN